MYGHASEPTIGYVFSGLFSHLCFLRVFLGILQESAGGVSSEASFRESGREEAGSGRAALWFSSLVFTDSQREDLE